MNSRFQQVRKSGCIVTREPSMTNFTACLSQSSATSSSFIQSAGFGVHSEPILIRSNRRSKAFKAFHSVPFHAISSVHERSVPVFTGHFSY